MLAFTNSSSPVAASGGSDCVLIDDEVTAEALHSGARPLPVRRRNGYVRTPDMLANELCAWPHHDLRWLSAGARVLEPSAGDGSLVAAILRINPGVAVTAVEPHPVRAAACNELGPAVRVHNTAFEQYAATATRQQLLFDAVVMNPPFAISGQAEVWLEHLRAAWHLLRPGGRLVAVVPDGFAYRTTTIRADARTFVEHHGSHLRLPGDAFAESGVTVAAQVVRMTKPISLTGPDHLLAPVFTRRPVRVGALQLTAAAAVHQPAQLIAGGWHGSDRVARFHGRCISCGWLLWGFDDGGNDPRGPIGPFSAGFSLRPDDYDMHGPTVGLCLECGNNNADRYHAAVRQAHQYWSPAVALSA